MVETREDVKEVKSLLLQIQSQMSKVLFHVNIDIMDLSVMFPADNDNAIYNFLDDTHPDFDRRRRVFLDLLRNCISSDQKKLAKAFIDTVFTRRYIEGHKWPSSG